MKLDRHTARALVDANLMSLKEYVDMFGSPEEMNAGKTDALQVRRVKPESHSTSEGEAEPGFPRTTPEPAVSRSHCH